MRARFLIGEAEHEVWLTRPRGYRLHGEGFEGGVAVALEASRVPSPPAGEGGLRASEGRMRDATRRPGDPSSVTASPCHLLPQGEKVVRQILSVDGTSRPVTLALDGDDVWVHLDGRTHRLRYLDPVARFAREAADASNHEARAPMPGTVVAIHVAAGEAVEAGAPLLVIESMKLETTIRAPRAGTVETMHVREGQSFDRDAVLVTLTRAA